MCRINPEALISNIQHQRIVTDILFNAVKLQVSGPRFDFWDGCSLYYL